MIKQHPTLPILCDSETGMICRVGKDKWTFGSKHKTGYRVCGVANKSYRVHRLIADTFLPPDDERPEVDHIDRNRENNCLANLRRVSHKENAQNTSAFKSVEDRGWRHKNNGYVSDRYQSVKTDEHHKELARANSRRWIARNPDKHRENALKYYHRMMDAGYRNVKCPDGKHHWVKGDSISSTA